MRRFAAKLLGLLLVVYIAIVGWVYINQRALMYFPDHTIKEVAEYNLNHTEDFLVKSSDGKMIQMWFHKPTKADMPVVLYFHGNSHNLGFYSLKFKELIDLGYGFLVPSYHGFGKSEGSPNKDLILEDARTAVKTLQEKGYKTEDVVLIGESLGTGPALQMAVEHQFKAICLIAPYTSIVARAQEIYWYIPTQLLLKDNFTNDDKIANVKAPIFIVHGGNDEVIPDSHSKKLFEVAVHPKKLVIYEGKNHNNLDTRDVFRKMTDFFMDPSSSDTKND